MITGAQIRMARAALRWKVTDLADAAEVPWARVQVLERTDGPPEASEDILRRIKDACERAGAIFLDADTDADAGVRLARRPLV